MNTASDRAEARPTPKPSAAEGMAFLRAVDLVGSAVQAAGNKDVSTAWARVRRELHILSGKLADAREDVMRADERARGVFSRDYVQGLRREAQKWRLRAQAAEAEVKAGGGA